MAKAGRNGASTARRVTERRNMAPGMERRKDIKSGVEKVNIK